MFPQGVYMTPFFMPPMSFIIFIQSILLLVPGSSPQMPRFEIPSNSYGSSGHMGQVSRPRVLAGDKCPGPSDIPWCQCRHDNSGISLTCHNIDQVVYRIFTIFFRIIHNGRVTSIRMDFFSMENFYKFF